MRPFLTLAALSLLSLPCWAGPTIIIQNFNGGRGSAAGNRDSQCAQLEDVAPQVMRLQQSGISREEASQRIRKRLDRDNDDAGSNSGYSASSVTRMIDQAYLSSSGGAPMTSHQLGEQAMQECLNGGSSGQAGSGDDGAGNGGEAHSRNSGDLDSIRGTVVMPGGGN